MRVHNTERLFGVKLPERKRRPSERVSGETWTDENGQMWRQPEPDNTENLFTPQTLPSWATARETRHDF